jgi:ATP-dependent RNA helicase DDX24/MAK5
LLRALEFNCRTIHAQLQQRQRLKALEAFQSAPIGVLVATDVAARGLDISKIQSVVHYDIARSPQVYIHRSGRTARANTTGTTVSLVNPEDSAHHAAICSALAAAGTSMSKVVEVVEDTAATNAPSRKKNRKGKKGDAQQQPQPKPVENVIERTPKLPALPVDLSLLPPLRERVRLAKKIFTQSFVVSKRGKEQSWLKQSAQEADLDLDEYTKVCQPPSKA